MARGKHPARVGRVQRRQFIATIQNITNHYNYAGYNGTMTSPFFGKPQSVLGTRSVNFGIGLTF